MNLAEHAHYFNSLGHLHILWMALFYVDHLMVPRFHQWPPNIIPRSQDEGHTNILRGIKVDMVGSLHILNKSSNFAHENKREVNPKY